MGAANTFNEATIQRVMDALDDVLDEPIGAAWEAHLRKCALAAIFAATAAGASPVYRTEGEGA